MSIGTLDALLNHTSLDDGQWGVLAFDFDQTLVCARPTLGDEHFYRFLMEKNRQAGINEDAHYHWTATIRRIIPYQATESVEKINRIISTFEEKRWSVVILTSRGVDMKEATKRHLEEAKIAIPFENVIFKEMGGRGKLLTKDESLRRWMEQQVEWRRAYDFRVVFLDDNKKYCQEVANIANTIQRIAVTTLHYTGALPNPELSLAQMERLVVQLFAYREGYELPNESSPKLLEEAKASLSLQKLEAEELYRVIRKVGFSCND